MPIFKLHLGTTHVKVIGRLIPAFQVLFWSLTLHLCCSSEIKQDTTCAASREPFNKSMF